MEDYFGYDVMYQMNITDVDDKARAGTAQKAAPRPSS